MGRVFPLVSPFRPLLTSPPNLPRAAWPLFVPVGGRDGSVDSLGSIEDLASPVRIYSCRAPPGKASR